MMKPEFAYPWVLLFLLLLLPITFYLLYRRRRPSIVVSTAEPFRGVRRRRRLSFSEWCLFAAFATLVIAAARPRLGDERTQVRAEGIDMMLVLDMSGSMEAIDIPKEITTAQAVVKGIESGAIRNRIETAKTELRRFIEARPNDRIGLVGFAELAYTFAPPTLDHNQLYRHLAEIKAGQLGNNTGIASAVAAGVNRLKTSQAPRRVLVLFTDGRNNVENRLTPPQTALLAKEFNDILHTVGIGSGNAVMPVTRFGQTTLQPYRDEFDEKLLKELAAATTGSYFHAADANGMKQVMNEINRLETTSAEQPRILRYQEFAPRLALLTLILTFLALLADSTWKRRLP